MAIPATKSTLHASGNMPPQKPSPPPTYLLRRAPAAPPTPTTSASEKPVSRPHPQRPHPGQRAPLRPLPPTCFACSASLLRPAAPTSPTSPSTTSASSATPSPASRAHAIKNRSRPLLASSSIPNSPASASTKPRRPSMQNAPTALLQTPHMKASSSSAPAPPAGRTEGFLEALIAAEDSDKILGFTRLRRPAAGVTPRYRPASTTSPSPPTSHYTALRDSIFTHPTHARRPLVYLFSSPFIPVSHKKPDGYRRRGETPRKHPKPACYNLSMPSFTRSHPFRVSRTVLATPARILRREAKILTTLTPAVATRHGQPPPQPHSRPDHPHPIQRRSRRCRCLVLTHGYSPSERACGRFLPPRRTLRPPAHRSHETSAKLPSPTPAPPRQRKPLPLHSTSKPDHQTHPRPGPLSLPRASRPVSRQFLTRPIDPLIDGPRT